MTLTRVAIVFLILQIAMSPIVIFALWHHDRRYERFAAIWLTLGFIAMASISIKLTIFMWNFKP